MVKLTSVYVCSECGYETKKWMGRCPGCNSWNTMLEEIRNNEKAVSAPKGTGTVHAVKLSDITADNETRYHTGMPELDRVLGGGFVKGSLVLVGGDPGIGKSTLLLQICRSGHIQGTVLYVSGEESAAQIKIRANRLNVSSDNILLLAETDFNSIVPVIENVNPQILIIDSIQTMYNAQMTSAPGSVSQVRDITSQLMDIGKKKGITVLIVGHVTKEGAIAGPRVLEHMVDTVLYFEGERHLQYRILRAVKNRFGSTNEIGLFEMCDKGLVEVENASATMLSGRDPNKPGSVVTSAMEGTRPMLLEIQALVSKSFYPVPRRMATGLDDNRVTMLLAVLEKLAGLPLVQDDVYVNIAGGLRVGEPACDTAIMAAVASSLYTKCIPSDTVVMGEVGLTGEVRAISGIEKRIGECARIGFKRCLIPKSNYELIENKSAWNIKLESVPDVKTLIQLLFK
ncbi:MAG TPA: DNA repair protein RadA [Clostridiales bacterium]|nr:DNA repair protein RadA [Clostridiales bacterium]